MSFSVSGVSSAQYTRPVETNVKLTDDQKKQLTEIIGKYDSSSMTKDSMKSMMDEIKSAGISQGKELRETLDTAGFKPPEKPKGEVPDQSGETGTTNSQPQFVLDFLEKAKTGQLTSTDISSLVSSLQSSGRSSQGSLIDTRS